MFFQSAKVFVFFLSFLPFRSLDCYADDAFPKLMAIICCQCERIHHHHHHDDYCFSLRAVVCLMAFSLPNGSLKLDSISAAQQVVWVMCDCGGSGCIFRCEIFMNSFF